MKTIKLFAWRIYQKQASFKKSFKINLIWINGFLMISLFSLALNNWWWFYLISLAIIFLLSLWLSAKHTMLFVFGLVIFYGAVSIHNYLNFGLLHNKDKISSNFTVVDLSSKAIYLQDNLGRKFALWKNNVKIPIFIYQKIYVQGYIYEIKVEGNYFLANGIYYAIKPSLIKDVENLINFRFHFFKYYSTVDFIYKELILPLLFGFNLQDQNQLILNMKQLGVVQLIVVSGLHFTIVYNVFKALFYKVDSRNIIALILLSLYFFMCEKSVSVFRAYLFILISEISNQITFLKKKVNSNSSLTLLSFLFLCYNPTNVLNIGYWLSFLLTYVYLTLNSSSNKDDEKMTLKQKIKVHFSNCLLIWIYSFVIILTQNSEVSLFSFFYCLILTPVFELVLIFFTLFFWANPFCIAVGHSLNNVVSFLTNWNYIIGWNFSYLKLAIYCIMYLFFVWFNFTKKFKSKQLKQN
ncbi:hypothetical protein FIV53_00605 [Mycoplasma nasistruthionis]|uniref:ComEC/Rec2-related protein domain-containing protein n=2 Tax=Mycoplasma nasistruthionis TaxID=353852 RepID=A0A4Y6I5D0_9MOLU|nr:hypothetical protein FIV53_00605 [Mycoplasma nasistruthionis]